MPFLSCSAVNCVYNQDKYCSKGDIMVEGNHAQRACETCCSSFKERGNTAASNSMGAPSASIYVDCSACNCQYNENRKCHAERIDITGASACECRQTECSTFEQES